MATRARLVLPLQPKPAPTQRPRGAERTTRSYELATRQAKAPMRLVLRADATAGRRDAGARKLPTRAAAIGDVRANADATGTKNNNLVQALLAFCVTMAQKLQGLVPLSCRRSCHFTQLVITLPHAFVLRTVAAVSSQKVTNGILMDLKGSCASEVNPHPAPTSSVKPGTTLRLKSSSTTMRDLHPRMAGQRRMTNEACTSWPLVLVSAQPPRKRSWPVHVGMANQEPSITRSSKARFCAPVRMAWECCKCRLGVGSTSRGHVGEQRQVQHVNLTQQQLERGGIWLGLGLAFRVRVQCRCGYGRGCGCGSSCCHRFCHTAAESKLASPQPAIQVWAKGTWAASCSRFGAVGAWSERATWARRAGAWRSI